MNKYPAILLVGLLALSGCASSAVPNSQGVCSGWHWNSYIAERECRAAGGRPAHPARDPAWGFLDLFMLGR